MPLRTLSHFILLPELKLTQIWQSSPGTSIIRCEKIRNKEFCPKCALPSYSLYDKRIVKIKDAPIRGVIIKLEITKHRFYCRHCKKPFTEYIPGIKSRKRHTERFERAVRWAAETFTDLKKVKKEYRISSGYLYKSYYHQLELRRKTRLYPWPTTIGIDEHAFGRCKHLGITEFASLIVDLKNKRVMEVVDGKTTATLEEQLAYIPGRDNVRFATVDLCDPFKNFVRNFFPNAECVADKFHVLRLLSPALLRKRKEITGSRADLRAKKLLLMSSHKLDYFAKLALKNFLSHYPEMHELYIWKERLHGFYRIKGFNRAKIALQYMLDAMALSKLPEIKTLRKTLFKWKNEILNYFKTGLTNARVEGFNNKAKLVKRRAYGYKSFRNYRLRLLDACS